jgi:hypothetical protein
VAWTDGSALDVALSHTHGGAHAVYESSHLPGITLKGAWANMPAGWVGRFEYVVGPCDAVDGGAVYGEPPVAGMGFLSFTPTRAGPHVVQVTYREAAGVRLVPVPAPFTVDPEPYVPVDPASVVEDPTGTLDGLGHGHGQGHGHPAGEDAGGPLAAPAGLFALQPGVDADAGQPSPEPPGPLAMPMSCHMCIGEVGDAVEKLSYRLAVLTS